MWQQKTRYIIVIEAEKRYNFCVIETINSDERRKVKTEIKKIDGDFTVCKVVDFSEMNFEAGY